MRQSFPEDSHSEAQIPGLRVEGGGEEGEVGGVGPLRVSIQAP